MAGQLQGGVSDQWDAAEMEYAETPEKPHITVAQHSRVTEHPSSTSHGEVQGMPGPETPRPHSPGAHQVWNMVSLATARQTEVHCKSAVGNTLEVSWGLDWWGALQHSQFCHTKVLVRQRPNPLSLSCGHPSTITLPTLRTQDEGTATRRTGCTKLSTFLRYCSLTRHWQAGNGFGFY